MDLGDTESVVCVLDADGSVVRSCTVETDLLAMSRFFKRFDDRESITVAMECGTHSPWISDLLESLSFQVLVGNARKLRVIWDTDNKYDERDAEMLARIARFDPQLLRAIRHRGTRAQMDLATLKARDVLVKSRTSMINALRGIVKSAGDRLPSCSSESFAKKVAPHIPPALRPASRPLLSAISALTKQISAYDRYTEKLCNERYPETERLRAVQGVGPITALAFVLTLDRPERFKRSRGVGPYLGLVPRRDQSGQIDKPLPITKAGNTQVRRLLVGAANYIMGPFGPDCDLRRFGLRLAGRGGTVSRRKAKTAVARKLAVLLHHLWVDPQEQYEPFHREHHAKTSA